MTTQKPSAHTVLITGSSSGIGKACALRLDQLGYRVFAGVRKPVDGEALQEIASERLTPVILDVTDEGSIASARELIVGEVGINDSFSLVNNAGFGLAGPVELQPLEDFRQQMEVNFFGAVSVTQAFIQLLRQSHGRIVNIGSISGINAMPFQSAYCATKFALEAFSDALRVELRPWGVSVSIVQPGDIQTPAWQKGVTAADKMITNWPPEALARYGPIVEMMKKMAQDGRGLPADEVAKVVARLLNTSTPQARVLVGTDAKILAFIERLPTSLRDWLIFRQLPKYG